MPGVVVSVAFKPGDAVKEGQPLLVIESMKLETTLSAPRDGVMGAPPLAPVAWGFWALTTTFSCPDIVHAWGTHSKKERAWPGFDPVVHLQASPKKWGLSPCAFCVRAAGSVPPPPALALCFQG